MHMPTGRYPAWSSVQKSWPVRSLVNGRPFGARCSSPPRCLTAVPMAMNSARSAADVEPHPDDAVGAQLVGLLLHPRHGQLTGVVHRLGEDVHLLVLVPVRLLEADVVDRAADDEAERVEPGLLHEQELPHRQIGGEEPRLVLRQPPPGVCGEAFGRRGVVAHCASLD
jgi:hypothetical protein